MVDGIHARRWNPGGDARAGRPRRGAAQPFSVSGPGAGRLPDLPPAEVLDALDTAARVLHELDRKQVSVKLEHDPATNELRAHVGDGNGETREISHARLLNVLAGDTASLYAKS